MSRWRDRLVVALATVILGTTLVSAQPFSRPGGPGLTVVAGGGGSTTLTLGTTATSGGTDLTVLIQSGNTIASSNTAVTSILGGASSTGINYISGTGDHTFSDGNVIVPAGTSAAASLILGATTNSGLSAVADVMYIVIESQAHAAFLGGSTYTTEPGLRFQSDGGVSWTASATDANTSADTFLTRGGAAGAVSITDAANGKAVNVKQITESHTLAAAGTSDTTVQFPANAVILGVAVRVTTTITGCTTFQVGDSGSATRYGTGLALTAGTTNQSGGTTNPTIPSAAQSIRFTCVGGGASFTAGVVRVVGYYIDMTAPTS